MFALSALNDGAQNFGIANGISIDAAAVICASNVVNRFGIEEKNLSTIVVHIRRVNDNIMISIGRKVEKFDPHKTPMVFSVIGEYTCDARGKIIGRKLQR